MQAPVHFRFVALLVFTASSCGAALGQPQALITNVDHRTTQSLDGLWRVIIDPYDTGLRSYRDTPSANGFFRDAKPFSPADLVEYDFDTSPTLVVPGDWNTQRPELLYYEGTVWYRRLFRLAPRDDRRMFVHFGAANYAARIYLNGELLGTHEGGFTPFQFEITDYLRKSESDENAASQSLVVMVNNDRRPDAVPTNNTDWWNYGGLTRRVLLIETPTTLIRDATLQLDPNDPNWAVGEIQLDGPQPQQAIRVEIPELHRTASTKTGAEGRATLRISAAEAERWSPERPKCYTVRFVAETDALEDEIGFRTIMVRGREILLNDEPIFLRGISLHEERPFDGGRAFSPEHAATLLGWARELNCNFVRLAHYPHNEAMLRAADRLGLLVWCEIPVYWTIDFESEAVFENAARQLAEMITRDRNRACVAMWSVGNETPRTPARLRFMRRLVQAARELDATRPITAALETHYRDDATIEIDDPLGAALDILGCNEYIGWYDGPPSKADRLEWVTPYDKPLIISEFGAGALAGRHGDAAARWTEEYQAEVYRRQLAMLERIPFLRGTTPWILKDFRSPRRLLPGIQDGWNRKGVISERGQRKAAFEVLRDWYARRAAARQP